MSSKHVGSSSSSTSISKSDGGAEFCTNISPRKLCFTCSGGLDTLRSLVKIDKRGEDDNWLRKDNLIVIGARCFETSYRWTRHYMHEYFTPKENYWKSVIASVGLFLIGVKLMREIIPSKVPTVELF